MKEEKEKKKNFLVAIRISLAIFLCYDAGWTKILLAQKIKSKNKKLR
jgi:hypothetical protein